MYLRSNGSSFFQKAVSMGGRTLKLFDFKWAPGLPDGIFEKAKFGKILGDLGIENVGIFNGHLVYFIPLWYI
jgi:hypothetical protein